MLLKAIEDTEKFNVPVGSYRAKLTGYKEAPPSKQFPDSKPSYIWEFQIIGGPHDGKFTSRFTPQILTTGNKLGQMLGEMRGRKITKDEEVNAEHFIGKTYQITVNWNKTATRTNCILCTPDAQTATPPPPQAPPRPSAPMLPGIATPYQAPPPPPAPPAMPTPATPESYQVSIAGNIKIISAEEATRMLAENLFTAHDFILDGQAWKMPKDVLYPF